ncbi:LON peptidase substrate-binding domain-containing protein [Akkermansiaceae bacterium]|nr:LON peptidase substrate-binding domain-containing protein [Akkermansiaceae bacterium]
MDSLTIPEKCGVILLPDTILFPHGAMPLHIFEDRYRQMVEEALEGDCMFCIGNLLGSDSSNPEDHAAKVGTIGLIRASRESLDGTSNLVLHGVFRVHFDEWLDEKPYPYARIHPLIDTTLTEEEEEDYLVLLRAAVNMALKKFPTQVSDQVNELLDRADDATTSADAIAQQFIHDPNDRQRLLENGEVRQRLDFVITFLQKAGLRADEDNKDGDFPF